MGFLAKLLSFERNTIEGCPVAEVKIDQGGDTISKAEQYLPSGVDSQPLPGDFAYADDASDSDVAVGYLDPKIAGTAGPGEIRLYARDSSGNLVINLRLSNDGKIYLGSDDASDAVSPASKVDQEINRIWQTLTGFTPSPGDGGAALKTFAIAQNAAVQSVASDKIKMI